MKSTWRRDVNPVEGKIANCEICCNYEEGEKPINGSHDRTTSRSQKMKVSLLARLNRIEGQVRGIKGMIEKDSYCDDVLNQIFAVQSAMKSVGMLLMENHMKSCIVNRIQAGEMEVVDELLLTIGKLIK
jgi:CsoR family transcriptional regulator, copper-sensing transcriptional repressor